MGKFGRMHGRVLGLRLLARKGWVLVCVVQVMYDASLVLIGKKHDASLCVC